MDDKGHRYCVRFITGSVWHSASKRHDLTWTGGDSPCRLTKSSDVKGELAFADRVDLAWF